MLAHCRGNELKNSEIPLEINELAICPHLRIDRGVSEGSLDLLVSPSLSLFRSFVFSLRNAPNDRTGCFERLPHHYPTQGPSERSRGFSHSFYPMNPNTTKTKPLAMTAGELLDREFPKREWLIEGLLRERQLALVYAPSGVGKSWFAWSLACMVAGRGHGLHEYSNATPRKVLIIDGEMDGEDAQERLATCSKAVHADAGELRGNLQVLSRQLQTIDAEFPNFDDPEWQARVLQQMQKLGTELVVLDNLSTLLKVEDENSSAALDGFTDFLLLLKRAGISAIVIHHANKAGSSYRGSQKISVTFDLILSLSRPAGVPEKGCCVEVSFEKNRGLLNSVPFRVSLRESRWVKEESDAEAQMALDALKSGKFKSYQELADGLDEDKNRVYRWIGRAIQSGLATKADVDAAFNRAKFQLSEIQDEPAEALDF